jgi:hypothetical protein
MLCLCLSAFPNKNLCVFPTAHHFYKRFLQHAAFFSFKLAFFFLTLTLNTVSARDFCNMLHFSLLNLPRSAKFAAQNAKAPGAGQACFEGNHGKFYFAFGPRPYFFR